MLICFDVGNSQIHGGFYNNNEFLHTFRLNTKIGWSSDQLGIFLKSFCNENGIKASSIEGAIISSVVPSLDYHLRNACLKYFGKDPLFVKSGIKTGISIKYKASHEIGADLICNTVGAVSLHPDINLIVIDMGTATTITAITNKKEFITGLIIPGLQTQVMALSSSAEKLVAVELVQPKSVITTHTTESMQAGIYYAHLGGLQFIISKLAEEVFGQSKTFKVIATGGFSRLFRNSNLFHVFDSDLVLRGLVKIFELNNIVD